LYLTLDGGINWRCIFVIPKYINERDSSFFPNGGCLGGSSDSLVIGVAHRTKNPEAEEVEGYTLLAWTPSGKVRVLCDTPPFDFCRFASSTVGAYVRENSLFVTANGGHDWRECIQAGTGLSGTTINTLFDVKWISPSQFAVAAQYSISLYEMESDGSTKMLWKQPVVDCESIPAEQSGVFWILSQNQIKQVKLADGSPIQAVKDSPRLAEMLIYGVLEGKAGFYLPEGLFGVAKYEIANGHFKLRASIPTPVTDALIPRSGGGVLIVTDDDRSNLFEWDGTSASATAMAVHIDNSAIREADRPGPDQPTDQDLQDFVHAAMPLDADVRETIGEAAEAQKDWSPRQSMLWQTEQFKAALRSGNKWSKPEKMPPANAGIAGNSMGKLNAVFGYAVGYSSSRK
jgi:hypothetical protein